MWKFDFFIGDLVWSQSMDSVKIFDAEISMGEKLNSDISLDCGLRSNDTSIIDQGERVIEVTT
jgi:hypothetical protein